MAGVSVSGEVEAPVEVLWGLLRDFGNVSWMNGVDRCVQEGEGDTATRLIYAGGSDTPVREVCEGIDDATRTLRYAIPENNPLPVDDYHSTVVAVDLGNGRSRIDWSCSFEPKGDAEASTKAVEGMYGVLVSWVKTAAEAR